MSPIQVFLTLCLSFCTIQQSHALCGWLSEFTTTCIHEDVSSINPGGFSDELKVLSQTFTTSFSRECTAVVHQTNYDKNGNLYNEHDGLCVMDEVLGNRLECTWYSGESFHTILFTVSPLGKALRATGKVAIPEDGVWGVFRAECS